MTPMLTEKEGRQERSDLRDSESVYGWISILLHWATAIVIIALWFIGKGIASLEGDEIGMQRRLHVSIAAGAWLLIAFRIAWRFVEGHPHVRGQTVRVHRIAKVAHYAMLIVVALMLLSGPIMVWARGFPIGVFGWFAIPGPIGESESVADLAYFIHSNSAMLLFWLVLLHIGGALKHLMFHADDTIARMIWPGKRE